MGPRITIDSATLMNKGFEIIEAAWLFAIDPSRVDVVIHPQSVVHSMVEFTDNSVIAQMGTPDMTLPIAYALFGPSRPHAPSEAPRIDLSALGPLEFEAPDPVRYPALELARRASASGPTACTVLNGADEVAVAAFLEGKIRFPAIVDLCVAAVDAHSVASRPSIDDITAADRWARDFVNQRVRVTYTDQRVPSDWPATQME
jgi:1-deoxy-D-xylulose-5-phosphate reductoisomerase